MNKEIELFTLEYPHDPQVVWSALCRATATMGQARTDDSAMTVQFSTGVSLTSWGEHMIAQVAPARQGAQVVVRGRPKGSFLTTELGEKIHARGIRKDLEQAMEGALPSPSTAG
ncbi:hypothetical protein [Actinomadura vinacea]